ncbi:fimbrillin family protein [uncultured Bacteroides sp.]|uniref:fimbrillin family protein n=1 Tax=uncultured Bacteroides sp. TaxID=162156 RepID=UPI0025D8F905|nr:fimbrillin family protein [uncultured Bacteroides sp.]
MNKNVKLLGMTAMLSITFAACSNDELVESYQGEGISFTTQVRTRANVTNLNNLKAFRVYADADKYNTMFINGDVAKKENNTNKYILKNKNEESYFWPSNVNTIRFWAYGPAGNDNKDEDIDIEPKITAQNQTFGDYTPTSNLEKGGESHKDLVVAYTEATRTGVTGMNVELKFNHALSQIAIKAKCGPGRYVDIKGAWLMNVYGSGQLSFDNTKVTQDEKEVFKYKNCMRWDYDTKPKANYGVFFKEEVSLNQGYASLIKEQTTEQISEQTSSSSLMLIPQKAEALNNTATSDGAYILLLCRVEVEHPGAEHLEGDEDKPATSNATHKHQLFPANDTVDETQYGYTCVPITPDWQPGVTYIYNLEFCGANSGAGIYPPDGVENTNGLPKSETGVLTIVKRPTGKNPGDLVLDYPISFKVSVEEWESAKEDESKPNTPMS